MEQLFVKLKNNHLVKSVRGPHGGYVLEKKPKDIKLSSIIFAVNEEVKTLNCKKDSKKGCDGRSVKCITHYLWDDLEKHINGFFENKNLNELILKKENIGAEISIVVENNLKQSGLFNPLNKDAFLQEPDIANLKPRFEDWNLIKAQALVTGKVTFIDEKLRVEFRLWDVLAGKEMMALAFTTVPSNWRRVGHIITDKVYERLTGEKGYFDTRIIYISEEGPKTNRIKKLAIMDQDGFNNKFLTLGNELVLTPRFSPTNQMVTYLSYFRNLPRVYLLDIETGMQEVVGDFPGMTFAPRFSPNDKKIIMSFAKDGNSDIYTMNIETRLVEKITDHTSIDTSPSYSPDGKFICFNSDRSGLQQIYVMRNDGSNVKRITFVEGLY